MPRLIVDGYNVLHEHPAYAALAERDFDSARAHLVSDLAGLAQGGPRVVVVFDGGGNPDSDGTPHHLGSLTIVFSRSGESADTLIESLAARSRERGEDAVVITSDAETRQAVLGGCISVLSAANFLDVLGDDAFDRSEAGRVGARRVPVDERIDADVRQVLAAWARGRPPASDQAR